MFPPNNHKGEKTARLEFHLWSKSTSHHNHNMVTMIMNTYGCPPGSISNAMTRKIVLFLTGGKKRKCFIEQKIRFLKKI